MKESTFRVKAENDAYGTSAYDILDLAVNGVDTTKDREIAIKADGYKDVTYTIAKTSGGGSTTAPSKPETPDTETGKDYPTDTAKLEEIKEPLSDTYYRLSFTVEDVNTLDVYLKELKEVSVNGSQVNLGYGLYSSNQCKVSSDNGTRLYIDFTEDVFTVGTEATIIIKADGYKTLTLKLTPTAK